MVINSVNDFMENPIERMFTIVELNKELLTNRALAQHQWSRCFPRMLQNLELFGSMEDKMIAMIEKDLKAKIQEIFAL